MAEDGSIPWRTPRRTNEPRLHQAVNSRVAEDIVELGYRPTLTLVTSVINGIPRAYRLWVGVLGNAAVCNHFYKADHAICPFTALGLEY